MRLDEIGLTPEKVSMDISILARVIKDAEDNARRIREEAQRYGDEETQTAGEL